MGRRALSVAASAADPVPQRRPGSQPVAGALSAASPNGRRGALGSGWKEAEASALSAVSD